MKEKKVQERSSRKSKQDVVIAQKELYELRAKSWIKC